MRTALAKVVFFATLVLKVVPAVIEALDAYEKAKPSPDRPQGDRGKAAPKSAPVTNV